MAGNKPGIVLRVGPALLLLGVLLTVSVRFLPEGAAFVRSTFSNGVGVFWPEARTTLNLQLGCPASPLANFGPCWDDAAADALTRWNGAAARFRFSRQSPPVSSDPCAHLDGVNTAAFTATICSMAFGSALAVTISRGFTNGALIDAGVVFDSARPWSSYPGPLQPGIPDLHRVAIHEFGHVLGLGHPDEAGQSVDAIMLSRISNLDSLQADDILGVNAIYPAEAGPTGALENPASGLFASGIGLISGWVCTAGRVTLQIDGSTTVQAAYGTPRADTIPACGDDGNNGFGFLINWNLLGNGTHTIVALADGVEFGRATFTVATLGQEFLRGASGRYSLPNFPTPGRNTLVEWQESLQNFVIVGVQ